MTHDKIRAAARKRMAETGEPYATARREVIQNYQEAGARPGAASSSDARFFALDYSDMDRISLWTDTLLGGGPGRGGVELTPTVLSVRVPGFPLEIPRASVRSATRSTRSVRGTYGVHGGRGRWLVNGSYSGDLNVVVGPTTTQERRGWTNDDKRGQGRASRQAHVTQKSQRPQPAPGKLPMIMEVAAVGRGAPNPKPPPPPRRS